MSAPLTPPVDLLTTAVLGLLKGSGRTVYDGAYGGDSVNPAYPYAVLYCLLGGDSDPTPDLDDRNTDITVPYQVTSVSKWRNQAQENGRVLRDRLLGRGRGGAYAHPLALPAGWVCTRRRPDPVTPGLDRAGDPPNAVFTEASRYLLTFTPA